jgi:hypothetical protein
MSLILRQSSPYLEQAVYEAAKNAVLICSTADDGNNNPDNWPAKFEDRTLPIASCNYHGIPAPYSTVNGAKYFLHGENMVPLVAQESKSQRGVSGSSVATAVASGLASLVLSCHQIANGGTSSENVIEEGNLAIVQRYFKEMTKSESNSQTSDPSSRYVKPWALFPKEKVSSANAREWIEEAFDRQVAANSPPHTLDSNAYSGIGAKQQSKKEKQSVIVSW